MRVTLIEALGLGFGVQLQTNVGKNNKYTVRLPYLTDFIANGERFPYSKALVLDPKTLALGWTRSLSLL